MNIIQTNMALYAFERFGDTVLRAAYSHTSNMSEAEDITQDVFLKLHASHENFNDDEHIKAWLLRVTINRCRNYHKSYGKKNRIELEDTDYFTRTCDFNDEDSEVLEAVRELPKKYSAVVHFYYYEGYSIKEIAELLGKNENTVSSMLQRARKKLKKILEED